MSVTATRIGSSPLTLDWTHFTRGTGGGPESEAAWKKLKDRFAAGEVGFYDSPTQESIHGADECRKLAGEILERKVFKDVLFLGIGGSSLGPISLLAALRERRTTGLNFHFMENPDPTDWRLTIQNLAPESTLVVCVAKSGTTFETIAQFLCALNWLGRERWTTHVVAVTDPEKGDLKAFAKQQNIPTLHIAPSMGGRFSVFTPVGLFPAALAGLSIPEFLKGATQTRDHFEKVPLEKNPAFILAHEFLRQAKQRPIHVMMPYNTQLRQMSSWFVQLWGESIGKDGKGFTPIAALGATDQHSILQLLRDGPDDKVTCFVTVDKVSDPVTIPRTLQGMDVTRLPSFAQLQGHTLHDLLMIEYRAISLVMTRRNRPHLTIQLDALDERAIGALYFFFCTLTAVTGTLWGVNPFDQPGVEEGKVYIKQALAQENPGRREELDENSPVARLRREQT